MSAGAFPIPLILVDSVAINFISIKGVQDDSVLSSFSCDKTLTSPARISEYTSSRKSVMKERRYNM